MIFMENRDDAAECLCVWPTMIGIKCVGDHVLGDGNNGFGIITDCLLPDICSVRPPVEKEAFKVVNDSVD